MLRFVFQAALKESMARTLTIVVGQFVSSVSNLCKIKTPTGLKPRQVYLCYPLEQSRSDTDLTSY